MLRYSFQRYNSTTCWSDHLMLSVQARPACLACSQKDRAQKISPGLLFTEGRVCCQQDRSWLYCWGLEAFYSFALVGRCSPPSLGMGITHPQPLCVGLSYTATSFSPLLCQQAERGISRGLWVSCWLTAAALGMMDEYAWAKQHSSLASQVNVSQCQSFNLVTTRGLKFPLKFRETLILVQNQNYPALTSFRL